MPPGLHRTMWHSPLEIRGLKYGVTPNGEAEEFLIKGAITYQVTKGVPEYLCWGVYEPTQKYYYLTSLMINYSLKQRLDFAMEYVKFEAGRPLPWQPRELTPRDKVAYQQLLANH
ncbi:MAG: hypothetical protein F6K53_20315 [Moorea sp. SIO4A1]|uniref:hypothetical protein n=1 Tax=Moorena sp. SIO4A1 TaxID=2607835 RepID=UPI00141807BC|nr:hypothetical protein [Moorena sp. SIO4A1]NEO43255.1 hypothetical protein [Moorena sp. SIO4A3]NEQ59617.1 hypothetical protein [Moorena sp. SIO4A1]